MFHKIHHMYSDIKNKEEKNAALLLTSISDHKDINKVSKTTVNSHENNHRTIFPPDLHQIQPRATQVFFKIIVYFDRIVSNKKVLSESIHGIETHLGVVVEIFKVHISVSFEFCLDEDFIELW